MNGHPGGHAPRERSSVVSGGAPRRGRGECCMRLEGTTPSARTPRRPGGAQFGEHHVLKVSHSLTLPLHWARLPLPQGGLTTLASCLLSRKAGCRKLAQTSNCACQGCVLAGILEPSPIPISLHPTDKSAGRTLKSQQG